MAGDNRVLDLDSFKQDVTVADPEAVMTVVQKPGVAAPVGALRTLGGIAVCRSQGGFCQDIQVISATSSVSGAVTRARPSP